MFDEMVFTLPQEPLPGWPCPNCGGTGRMSDGWTSISQTEIRIRPASKCYLCEGTGRVKITALSAEEMK